MLNPLGIEDSQALLTSQDNMFGLPAVEELRGAAGFDMGSRGSESRRLQDARASEPDEAHRELRRLTVFQEPHACHRLPTLQGTLGVNDVPADVIHGNGIGGKEERLPLPRSPRLVPAP